MPIGAFLTTREKARVPVSHGSSDMSRLQPFFYEAANRPCLPYSCFHTCLESEYEQSPFVEIGQRV